MNTNVDGYIAAAPPGARRKLREMRACVRAAAPGATEALKYGMPGYSYRRILVTFAAHTNHIGFYPTPSAIRAFKKELAGFVTSKGAIQFPLKGRLPLALVRKVTLFRVRESVEHDGKWRS